MGRALQFAGIATLALLVCSSAGAQSRSAGIAVHSTPGGAASMRTMPRPRPSTISPAPSRPGTQAMRRVSIIQIGPDGRIIVNGTTSDGSVAFGNEGGVPGLGFDYPHLAAISGGIDHNRFGSLGHHGNRNQGVFVPFLYGGFPYYDSYDYGDSSYDQQQQQPQQETSQQPQVIVVQPVIQQAALPPQTSSTSAPVPAAPPEAAVPANDASGYVLVLGNGRVVFASAFSIVGTQLQYVTPEGIRHTLPVADLDSSATQAMNEARGITFQLHN